MGYDLPHNSFQFGLLGDYFGMGAGWPEWGRMCYLVIHISYPIGDGRGPWEWSEWVKRSTVDFSDGLGQVLTIKPPKHVPNTPEHKSPTGVKILNLDL